LKTKNGEEEDADGEENGEEEEDATGTDQRRTARVSRDGAAAAEQKHRLCFSVFHFLFLIFFCFF
jgi:hypothetical protein